MNSLHLLKLKDEKTWDTGEVLQETKMATFSERESSFSLEIRVIRPSAVFGPRRKNVLRGAGYAWTPVF